MPAAKFEQYNDPACMHVSTAWRRLTCKGGQGWVMVPFCSPGFLDRPVLVRSRQPAAHDLKSLYLAAVRATSLRCPLDMWWYRMCDPAVVISDV